MRPLLFTLFAATLTAAASPPFQRPIIDNSNLGPAMPPSNEPPSTSKPADHDAVVLSDVLGKDREINIFAGFTRDFAPISGRFDDSSQNTTIIAPINSAIMALPRKPWENPEEYEELGTDAYGGDEGAQRARRNLQRFVESHVVPVSPWEEGVRVKTLSGDSIWWETKDKVKVVGLHRSRYRPPMPNTLADPTGEYPSQQCGEPSVQWRSLDLARRKELLIY